MAKGLSDREKRTLRLGLWAVFILAAAMVVPSWYDQLLARKQKIQNMEENLALIQGTSTKQAGLDAIVPVFEMPKDELKQKFAFREQFAEQLKKAGLKTEPLATDARSSGSYSSYRRLTLTYEGKARLDQILKLLASLKSNPYLAGVEEMEIKADPKQKPSDRKEMEFTLVVSTFVKKTS